MMLDWLKFQLLPIYGLVIEPALYSLVLIYLFMPKHKCKYQIIKFRITCNS
jgi:hypothetical protein